MQEVANHKALKAWYFPSEEDQCIDNSDSIARPCCLRECKIRVGEDNIRPLELD